MANGDPVTQEQFYNGQKEILIAVDKVGDTVNDLRVDVGKVETKLERVDKLEEQVGNLKTWDRIDTVVSGLAATVLAVLGINRGGE